MGFYRNWVTRRTWKEARFLLRELKLNRTETRLRLLSRFAALGAHALDAMDLNEILALRLVVGKKWFDDQVTLSDEGHDYVDPFRTLL